MWSQFAAGGPPPPPPPPAGGFPPPPPSQPTQAQQGGGFPPPPPQNFASQEEENFYESDNDSDEGGLGMTVNMVTSAASMLFTAARPLANPPPAFDPPPPTSEEKNAPPKFAPPPPAPIEQFSSMLDDDNEEEDEGMTEIDMNEETETTAAAPPPAVLPPATEAAMVFDRPPTPTPPSEVPSGKFSGPSAFTALPVQGTLGGPSIPSPTPYAGKLGFPPPSPKEFATPPVFGRPPTPPVDAHEVFARPPTPTQSAPPTPSAQNASPFSIPPPAPNDAINVFARPPTPTQSVPLAQNPFSMPPPTPSSASDVFAQPPTPTQQASPFAQAPPADTASQNPFSVPPPTPTQQQQFPPPATPNPPPQAAVFAQPPPAPQGNVSVIPPATPETPALVLPVSDKPDEMIPRPSQQPPQDEKALETIDVGKSEVAIPQHTITPPVSPRKSESNGNSEGPSTVAGRPNDTALLTPLINNQSKTSTATPTATGVDAATESSSKKTSLTTPSPRIRNKLRGPPPRSSIPTTTRTRSRFKLPTPRRSRSRTPVRGSASKTARSAGGRLPLPTPNGKEKLFSSPMEKKTPQEQSSSEDVDEMPTTPIATNVSTADKSASATISTPSSGVEEESKPPESAPLVEAKEITKPSPEKEVENSPEVAAAEEELSSEITESLPEGWAEATDPTTQQVYYYNSTTGETLWEHPSKLKSPAKEDIQNAEVDLTTEQEVPASQDATTSPETPAEEENDNAEIAPTDETETSSLPEGWEEAIDPTTEQVYYFNSISGETVWERPTKEVPSATEDEAVEPTEEPEMVAEENENEESFFEASSVAAVVDGVPARNATSDLPEGWEEAIDPTTEQVYYYNSITGETAWDRPTMKELPVTETEASEPPSTEPEIAGEASGNENSSPENESPDPPAEDTLPEDWMESVDDVGQTYYYNSQTGQTRWERPTETAIENSEDASPADDQMTEPEPEQEPEKTPLVDNASPAIAASETPENEIEPAESAEEISNTDGLPDGWIEATDPVSGNPYFYHSESGTVSWERPPPVNDENNTEHDEDDSNDDINLAPEIAMNEDDNGTNEDDLSEEMAPLPEGWIESFDPQTNNKYYYNSVTGDVSWDRPEASPEGEEAADETSQAEKEDETSEDELAPETETQTLASENKDPLPDGWIEDIDPKTEQVYYYNTFNGDVTWDRPGALSAEDNSKEEEEVSAPQESNVDPTESEITAPETEPELPNEVTDTDNSLPDDWEEVNDESTGQTYFYNRTTGESSWERPGGEQEVAEEKDEGEQDTDHVASTAEEEQDNLGHESQPTSSEIPSIDETLDALISDFGVEEPESKEEDTPSTSADEVREETEAEVTLAEGWVEELDPTSGQNYYYNTISGETSWERPAEKAPEDKSPTDIDSTAEEEAEMDSGSPESTEDPFEGDRTDGERENSETTEHGEPDSGTEHSTLPANWEKVEDDANGTYYYNSVTGETSWERPIDEVQGEDGGQVDNNATEETDVVEEDENDVDIDEDENASDVIDEWVESTDPTTGKIYYYNTQSGETSWEKPISSPNSELPEDVISEDTTAKESSIESKDAVAPISEDSASSLPEGWSEVLDATSGEVSYYQNNLTNAITFTKPIASEEKTNEVEAEDQIELPADADEDKQQEPDHDEHNDDETNDVLPEGWAEVEDPSSGQVYYYNSSTDESTWERPTSTKISSDEAGEENSQEIVHSAEAEEFEEKPIDVPGTAAEETSDEVSPENEDLPDNWVESTDPSTGDKYFYNVITEEVSWEIPTSDLKAGELLEAEETSPTDEQDGDIGNEPNEELLDDGASDQEELDDESQSDDGLPLGWDKVTDPSSGQTYYHNVNSGETSWERPVAEGRTEGEDPSGHEIEAEDANAGDDNLAEDVAGFGDLPEGWEEIQDETTGDVYYFNAESGETSWDRPNNIDDSPKEETSNQPADAEEIEDVSAENEVDDNAEIPISVLPHDWEEVEDSTTGNIYFFNSKTGETSWERPTMGESEEKDVVSDDVVDEADHGESDVNEDKDNNLPEGWEEVTDPSSGETYFYHAESGNTSWDRPLSNNNTEVEDSPQLDADTDLDDDEQSNVLVEANDEVKDTEENDSDDLPDGWEQMEDPSSGEIYFYHAESGNTSWERPIVADTPEGQVADLLQKDDDADEAREESKELPDGWKEVEDPSTGDIYYFHEESGETSWELPVIETNEETENTEEENAPVLLENEDGKEAEPKVTEEIGETVAEPLPEGWEEVEDPSSGEIYFYHAESGETSWERPGKQSDVPQFEQNEPETDVAENEDNGLNEENTDDEQIAENNTHDLPEDWEEVEDSSSGEIYYYNTVSGETSWEKPTTENPKTVLQDIGEEDNEDVPNTQSENDADLDSDDVRDSLPEDWTEMNDPDSGEIYYYNATTGETSWEKPKEEANEIDDPISQPEDVGSATEVVDGVDSEVDPLPDGWVESEDPDSGEVYYYHDESGEVSWERPTTGLVETLGHEASEEITFQPEKPSDDGELPDGWVESVDPDSGEVYYYHKESGDVSWEKPATNERDEQIAETQEIESEEVGDGDELPDGWVKTEDPSSGDMYYYHAESGETRWERPEAIDEDKEVSEPSADNEKEDVDQTNPEETSDANGDSSDPSPLPEFWVESEDPTTGEIYYFNSLTQETSWERPILNEPSMPPDSHSAEPVENKDEILDDELKANDDESTKSQELPLPDDWVESTDATTGDIYYYNVKTEETSWERPVPSSVIESDEQKEVDIQSAEKATEEEKAVDSDLGLTTAESEILDDWVEVNDPSGDKYYYNSKTGETSWEKPEKEEANTPVDDNVDSSAQDQSEDHLVDDNGLLEGWVEVVDPSSGECYWYNEETQETTWDKPSKSNGEVEDDLRTDDVAENADENIRDDWVDVQDEMPENENSQPEEKIDENNHLPDGWVENVDPSSGDVYYYNEITNETSWDPPSEMNLPIDSSDVAAPVDSNSTPAPESSATNVNGSISDGEDERKKHKVFGPFTLCDDSVVTEYITRKAQSKDILWQLIAIAVQSKGRLRSDYGVVDRSGPEAAIVKLLLSSSDYATITKTSKNDIVIEDEVDDGREGQDSIVKVQDLLIRGDRERAIEEAMSIGDFATALLVASMCDPDTYKRVAQKYAESRFRSDSPMYTTTMLFSGKIEAPSRRTSSNWGVNPSEVRKNWRSHLASIINNRTFGWDKIVLSLGDRLNEIGCIQEAHFCYMVCGYPITSPTDEETRVALLGCNHSDSRNRTLFTQEALVAFERTEAYEWAKRLGNQYAYFATFQPFKLIYAMLLADEGDLGQAQKFIQSIQISPDAARTAASAIKEVSVDQMFDDDVAFELAYNEIGQHLIKGGFGSKYKESVLNGGSLEITLSKGQTAPQTAPRNVKINDPLASFHLRVPDSEERDPSLDATFMTAKSNLMDVSGYTIDEKTPTKPAPVVMNQPPAIPEEKKQATPMPTPQPQKKQERPKASPATAPAVMSGKKKEEKKKPSTPAPASSGKPRKAPGSGAFGGMKSWIIKKLNPDAKEIHLPEDEGQAYYDKELKRWIFPGDDPAELAKPMAPPPMAIKKEEEKPKEDDKPKDAASMLMAPPPSRGISAKKRLPPMGASSPMMNMMMPPGGGAPGMMSPMAPGAGFATPKVATFTPKAAVFTPKPSAETPAPGTGEDEKVAN